MSRLVVYLAILAAGIGVVLLLPSGDSEQAGEVARAVMANAVPAGAGWVVGLAMGLTLSWLSRFDWHTIPARVAAWTRDMRHRIWWMACGGICAGVLLFF